MARGAREVDLGETPADPWGALGRVLDGLRGINAWLDQATSDSGDLGALLSGLAHVDAAVAAATSRAIVSAEVEGVPGSDGQSSPSAWVAQQLGLTAGEAGRLCRLAADLDGAPTVLDALTSGQISRGHAQTMAQAARQARKDADAAAAARRAAAEDDRRARERADREAAAQARTMAERAAHAAAVAERERRITAEQQAETERHRIAAEQAEAAHRAELLRKASQGSTPDQLRADAKARRAQDAEAMRRRDVAQHSRRAVFSRIDSETGMGHTSITLPPAEHDALHTALDALQTFDHPDVPAAERRTYEQRRADAVIDLVGGALKAGDLPTVRGVKPHITAVVPLATLTGLADLPGRTNRGTWLSADTARRLGCDAGLTRAVLGASSQVLDIGRETRTWTTAQYRHAEVTFSGCAFPVADGAACGRPMSWCDLHHVTYWRDGGKTDIANGVPLCRHHHTAVHHEGWQLGYSPETTTVTVIRDRRGVRTRRQVKFTPGLLEGDCTSDPPARRGVSGVDPPAVSDPVAMHHQPELLREPQLV
ncbi:HNH endonuclease [Euzebya tangerina]|uniref:HNH endonuclease n=1 Tax=Euzebya tangerina TaxID=591198 RepID=UPI0013C2FCFE|nr:HNH endonuclease [Euzebya tangerina]